MSFNSSSFIDDLNEFGPATPNQFDFTPLFENTVLSILPSVALVLALPFRLLSLSKQPQKVSWSLLHSNKLALLAVFTALQAVILVLYSANPAIRTPTTLATVSLVFLDAIGLCFLSHAEHVRSIRPSTIINSYLFVTLLFDVARTRTLWVESSPKSIAAVFTATTVLKFFVAITEAIEKRKILLGEYQHSSPEATSSIYSRSFFWWLNALMKTGFSRVISQKDLFALEDGMGSSRLRKRMQTAWNNCRKNRPHALFWSTLNATRGPLAVCIFPRLCLTGFRYAQPFLLSRTVSFINSTEPNNIGWGLTGAFGLVFAGVAIANGSFNHMSYRFATAARGGLIGIIYAKTVDLSIVSLDESAAITLMSNDTEAISIAFRAIHELWAVPVEIGISMWLLQRQLGLSFLAPAGVAIISILSVIGISMYVGGAQKVWNRSIQTRVDVTASMLGSMKAVKILGFTDKLTDIVQRLRVKEVKVAAYFRRLLVARSFFTNSMKTVAPLATFVLFVLLERSGGRKLTASTAYTALSLIDLLSNPVNTLLRTIPELNSALACFGRIQKFLESDSRQYHILPLNGLSTPSEDQAGTASPVCTESDRAIELANLSTRALKSDSILIDVRNASFAWALNSQPTINDVSFSVLRRNFVFVIGPVGCGKSTLVKGIMSETPSCKGFVYSDMSEFAFMDQTPWIQNITVRQNIVGQCIFDECWYDEVLKACALDYDIAAFPKRDASIVGSRGISMSGGQKQRLALARALYARKELIIIDDGFSGLDSETEEKIFDKLFTSQGLLRRLGTTVIFVTHAVHRLPYADHIVALDQTGHVTEQGSFDQLRTAGGYVEGFATKNKYDNRSSQGKSSDIDASPKEPQTAVVDTNKAKTTEEDLSRQTGEFATYNYYFASIGWVRYLTVLFLIAISGISVKLTELLVTFWTRDIGTRGTEVDRSYLGLYGILTAITNVGFIGGAYCFFLSAVPASAQELHSRLLKSVMAAPLHFFTSTDTGMTTNRQGRFSQDMSIVDNELAFSLVDLIISGIQTIMGAILMCVSAGFFTVTIPPIIFVVWVIQKYYLKTSRQVRLLDLEAKSPLYSHFIESLSGLVTIRAFGWSEEFLEQNLVLLDNSQKPYYLLFCIQRWLGLVMDLMVAVLAVILMVIVVKTRDHIGPTYVGLALLNVMGFSQRLTWSIVMWTALETSIGAIARVREFAKNTPDENLPGENQSVPENWPAHGALEFKNLSASYTASGTPVLQGLNMYIKPGERIGICGRSGSGKSSLTMTLFRMLEIPSESSIIVDGIDITTIPRQAVRSRINAIPQDPFFMKGSVRLNASPEALHSDEDITAALRKVQLWSVVESKGGLDTGLDAEIFSHGQRQLFCLARALLRKSKIVVLDEVSSSIDITTDKLIQEVIRDEFDGCTIISVAHRLDTILDFDRIALLSEGKLVEFDEPQALLNRPSAFRELYNS